MLWISKSWVPKVERLLAKVYVFLLAFFSFPQPQQIMCGLKCIPHPIRDGFTVTHVKMSVINPFSMRLDGGKSSLTLLDSPKMR